MPKPILVENWPMESYPWKTEGKRSDFGGKKVSDIYTNFFKAEVRNYDGTMSFHTFQARDGAGNIVTIPMDGSEGVQNVPKVYGITTPIKPVPPKQNEADPEWNGNKSRIHPVDLREMEEKIGGKPTSVLAGLWFRWNEERKKWEPINYEKTTHPLYWADVTERYYESWRPEAYKEAFDPFENQKRPYTRIQEMKKEAAAREAELAAKIAELEAKKDAVTNG
jgi:hypothetical protein